MIFSSSKGREGVVGERRDRWKTTTIIIITGVAFDHSAALTMDKISGAIERVNHPGRLRSEKSGTIRKCGLLPHKFVRLMLLLSCEKRFVHHKRG